MTDEFMKLEPFADMVRVDAGAVARFEGWLARLRARSQL